MVIRSFISLPSHHSAVWPNAIPPDSYNYPERETGRVREEGREWQGERQRESEKERDRYVEREAQRGRVRGRERDIDLRGR